MYSTSVLYVQCACMHACTHGDCVCSSASFFLLVLDSTEVDADNLSNLSVCRKCKSQANFYWQNSYDFCVVIDADVDIGVPNINAM